MAVVGIDHIQLAMPAGQEHVARAFYSGLLGLTELKKPPHLAPRGGCWFGMDKVKIHLGVEPDFIPAKKAHPGLLVDDLASLCSTLQNAGYETMADQPLEGFTRVYVNDPFGKRIELMQVSAR
ncbi:VOC family protein [Rhizobium tumorigenes]|uniref:Glyoxalase n=1 Tax=Rhizobium tumorigenes TaxID=2041385 RepID=A0AAF1K8A7_9HYPH|nr:VOC family protein [Rhizobium tumorigenes]WFR95839.1 glyoxalase [Rhizobium tumorigenes]